jgi:hypothetical protein
MLFIKLQHFYSESTNIFNTEMVYVEVLRQVCSVDVAKKLTENFVKSIVICLLTVSLSFNCFRIDACDCLFIQLSRVLCDFEAMSAVGEEDAKKNAFVVVVPEYVFLFLIVSLKEYFLNGNERLLENNLIFSFESVFSLIIF